MRGLKMAALVALAPLAACETFVLDVDFDGVEIHGSGYEVTESRIVVGFDEIEVSGGLTLIVEWGPSYEVEVTSDDNIVGYVETRRAGDRLIVRPEPGKTLLPSHSVEVWVRTPDFDRLSVSGAAWVSAEVTDHRGHDFELDVSGASYVELAGAADVLDVSISGASAVHALHLETDETYIGSSGASYVEVTVHDYLEVRASGASVVRYLGHPDVWAEVSGASSVGRY